MCLRVSFDESYEPIARVVNYSAYALLAPSFAMLMVVF